MLDIAKHTSEEATKVKWALEEAKNPADEPEDKAPEEPAPEELEPQVKEATPTVKETPPVVKQPVVEEQVPDQTRPLTYEERQQLTPEQRQQLRQQRLRGQVRQNHDGGHVGTWYRDRNGGR